jgi:sugar-specific transcriptional regulator TrmB
MDIRSYLKELDLTDKEVSVYLSCLELGETHVIPITQRVSLPRNSVVYILEKLREKCLIDIVERKNRRTYIPKPPRTLITLLRNRQLHIEEQVESLKKSLPELNHLYTATPLQPQVRIYRGRDEIRQLYEEMLQAPVNEIWYVGEYNRIIEVLGERYLREWIKRRIVKKIKTRSIRVRSAESEDPIFGSPKETNRQIRYAPSDFVSPGHVSMYGDTVAIVTTSKEDFGTVITSREYAEIMRSWFGQLWKVSSENKFES